MKLCPQNQFKSKLIGLKRNEKAGFPILCAHSAEKVSGDLPLTVRLSAQNLAYRFFYSRTFRLLGHQNLGVKKFGHKNYFWN